MDRLFVPLMKEYYLDFKKNGKTYELRKYGNGYTERHVFSGRDVELRLGYSGESQWGKIGDIVIGSIDDILKNVDFKKITPREDTKSAFLYAISKIYGNAPKYIAFEVNIG